MNTERIEFIKAMKEAITNGETSKIATLVDGSSEKLNMTISFGTWLHYAAIRSPIDVAKTLVGLGIDINKKAGTFNANALSNAASWGRPDWVRYLHGSGAKIDTGDINQNPLICAIQGGTHGYTTPGHTEVAKYLIDAGIDLTPKYRMSDGVERDALEIAKLYGRSEIAALIEAKLGA